MSACACHSTKYNIFFLCSFRRLYLKDYYNYFQLPAAVLPLVIIPFRAATTWCASTGDGYCVDPTLMTTSNTTNFTLDINQACITASSIQWIIASLAYMVNAILLMEFLTLSRYYATACWDTLNTPLYTSVQTCLCTSLSGHSGRWVCMWRSSKGWL